MINSDQRLIRKRNFVAHVHHLEQARRLMASTLHTDSSSASIASSEREAFTAPSKGTLLPGLAGLSTRVAGAAGALNIVSRTGNGT
ncbi:hypothetical protein [Reyranella soli]|uniref:hypothetical protein n=1 Tax=Reyranella soli TaxID=1230389 RepID=UPI0011BE6ED2|nr:hypothetical protein [Reyranella soli]